MKILKIFGIVVGIHVFALILIFANPGCSSTTRPAPAATETAGPDNAVEPAPVVSVPTGGSSVQPTDVTTAPITPAPLDYNGGGVRFTPTRPNSAAATAVRGPATVEDVTPVTTYTVVKGDSLWSIARRNHLTVAQLAAANRLKTSVPVRPGQKLMIPSASHTSAEEMPAAATTAPANPAPKAASQSQVKHTVKPGETLGAIARKYGVKVGAIATANNISDPAKIRPGMELVIPGATEPKTSRPAATPAPATPAPATPSPTTPITPAPETTTPIIIAPPSNQDLDSGLQPGTSAEPPVIQIEEPAHQ